ncbi:alpha/beta-hydrolase [Pleomassaria siparia CBS 279.74]|uniref:Dipeptidyl-peptidase V n=1 Tax=Pleomassaria siparia CBS 279.74 TaxID=1314801 RepID=A0A6G1KQA9_9PLEO|nr:alpha/beta-hydrolase [Pleomassaria siparia CBS 279.74]
MPPLLLEPRRARHQSTLLDHADLCQTPLYHSVVQHFQHLLGPAFGSVSDAAEPAACPNRSLLAFTGTIRLSLNTSQTQHVHIADTATGTLAAVCHGANNARSPQWAPDGRRLAFLSDCAKSGVYQVYVVDITDPSSPGKPEAIASLHGTAEAVTWSPDGSLLLVRVAELDADQAGALGSGTTGTTESKSSSWMPAWAVDPSTHSVKCVGEPDMNIWEVTWMGDEQLIAVVSPTPDEDAWYNAHLTALDLNSGKRRTLYAGSKQLGKPVASPSGRAAAVIEAVASDRGGIAGQVLLLDPTLRKLDMNGADITDLYWARESHLSFIGLRNGRTVAGHYCLESGTVEEHWNSSLTCGPMLPEAAVTHKGSFVVVSEGWEQPPALCEVHNGNERIIASFAHLGTDWLQSRIGTAERTTWRSTDGLEVDGILCKPVGREEPHPLVLNVHGGPVWAFRNLWQMRSPIVALLVARGYAVLSANPRGSVGRGPAYIDSVIGDMGGGDSQDLIAGIDSMVACRIADPTRLGVMGVSYGGYMAAWLPTLDRRFAAAVPIAAVTNWTSYHATSNIGLFDELFFRASPYDTRGPYGKRSPVMHPSRNHAPTLHIAGALDRCVPPSQAIEHHRALLDAGAESALIVYPQEGHGVRQFPAYLDFSCRVAGWFEHHMAA